MSITFDTIRTPSLKAWRARVTVNGAVVEVVEGLPTRVMSQLRTRSTCRINTRTMPATAPGVPVVVDLILEGVGTQRFFSGLADQRSASSARMSRQINALDRLNFDRTLGTALTWDDVAFAEAVADLLARADIEATWLDSVYDPGLRLGPVYPITLEATENLSTVWNDLMAYGGTSAFTLPTGAIRIVDNPGLPAETSAFVYARGATGSEFGITDAGYSIEGNEGVVSTYTVTGPKRPDGNIPDGTFTATGIVGTAASATLRFLQRDEDGQIIAEREL